MKMKWNSKKGWILEVDLEYPEELHAEKNAIRMDQMSEYQKRMMNDHRCRLSFPSQ